MKRCGLPAIFLLTNSFCFGQGPRFQLWLTKSCSDTERLDTTYFLMPAGDFSKAFFPNSGTVYLPAAGHYLIEFNEGPMLSNADVELKDTGLFVMHYKEPRIQLYRTGTVDTPPIYVKCDSALNGYQEDYYENGTLKMRGNFQNGNELDSMVTFFPNGRTKRRLVRLPKMVRIEVYDSLGNLVKLYLNERGSFMRNRDYWEKTFFPNGQIASEESDVKRVLRQTSFYPSGQIKLKQTRKDRMEYYENGAKKRVYKWKYKTDRDGTPKSRDFTIYRTWYERNGQPLQSAVFENWDNYGPQPNLRIYKSDRIVSLIKYQQGREVFAVKDIDTKEFLKKYTEDFDDFPSPEN